MAKKTAKKYVYTPKINGILIGLIASVILNLILAAPYVAFLTTSLFDTAIGEVFFERVLDGSSIEKDGRSWNCVKGEYTQYLAIKNQHYCYGIMILDENNQEVKNTVTQE
ncbi:hypothetical protein IT415_03950 [bacterium]|nr:hypothetical protein [bacterium]